MKVSCDIIIPKAISRSKLQCMCMYAYDVPRMYSLHMGFDTYTTSFD